MSTGVKGPGSSSDVELARSRAVGTSARDQRRALGVGDGELDGGVLHDVRHGLARQLVVDADRDQARRHGRHVEHQIVGAVGGDDGHGLAALQSALQQAARQGGDAPAALALGQAELFVAVGRELDDEVAVVRRGRDRGWRRDFQVHGEFSVQATCLLPPRRWNCEPP